MHKEIALRWAETLRSGNYQQTQGHLRDHMGHCCLGVLCDIYRVEQGKGEWARAGNGDYAFRCGIDDPVDDVLPDDVLHWAGMSTSSGNINHGSKSLVGYNDDERKSFPEIADIIDQEWEVL